LSLLFGVLLDGLSLGLLFALFAIGFSVVFSILQEMNFAYGDALVMSTFVAATVFHSGLPVPIVVLTALAVGAGLGIVVNFIAMDPLRASGGNLPLIVSSLGLALLIRNAVIRLWGPAPVGFPDLFGIGSFNLGGQLFSSTIVVALLLAVLLVPATYLLLKRTRTGMFIRAIAQDPLAARLVGVPVRRTRAIVYVGSGILGALAGLVFTSVFGVLSISVGFQGTIIAFIAVVLGGVRSLWGAVLGGLLVGLAEAFMAAYVSALYKQTFTFMLLVLVLLILPAGILGRRQQARV
jgi:branched-chain amino acid transport system permease protein